MTGQEVLRYEVPVDDEWHRVDSLDAIMHVASRRHDVVEFWATQGVVERRIDTGNAELVSVNYAAMPKSRRRWEYRVFGTGQPDIDGLYVGTSFAAGGALVWHLFRREVAS